jgi:hypothetical protein
MIAERKPDPYSPDLDNLAALRDLPVAIREATVEAKAWRQEIVDIRQEAHAGKMGLEAGIALGLIFGAVAAFLVIQFRDWSRAGVSHS